MTPGVLSARFASVIVSTSSFYFFFFFQAEDGIRDVAVTGVQTCALPILEINIGSYTEAREVAQRSQSPNQNPSRAPLIRQQHRTNLAASPTSAGLAQIGRASCRERV